MNTDLQNILEKVSKLYRKYGIKSITMDDVANELGISKKTLYQFVSDKTELVEKVIDYSRNCSFATMLEKLKGGLNAIEELIEVSVQLNALMKDYSPSYLYDLKKYYPEIHEKHMSARRKYMYESMLANIRKGKKEGLYRMDLNDRIIARLHLLRIENLSESEIFREEELHTTEFFREVFVYHIHGLATEKGLRVLERNMHRLGSPENQMTQ